MRESDFRYQLAMSFTCMECKGKSPTVKLFSLFGESEKRLSKFDVFDMIAVACQSCGKLEFFDKYFLPESDPPFKHSSDE